MSASCRSCEAPVLWARTELGKRMPLDVEPYDGDDPRGLFVLRERDRPAPLAVAAPLEAFPDESHYRSHFVTCPERDEWRKPRDPTKPERRG